MSNIHITGNTISFIVALLLVVMTVLVIMTIFYLAFIKDKKTTKENIPLPKKKTDFNHCELNDIMGYDFIQIKRIEHKKETEKVVRKEKSYADSQGLGLTERMGTTGRDEFDYEGERPVEAENLKKNKEVEKQNEELSKKAREEGKEEISNKTMEALNDLENLEWPEDKEWPDNTNIDPDRSSEANQMFDINESSFENEDESSDEEYVPEPEQALAAEAKEPEKHDSLMNEIFEKQEQEFNEKMMELTSNEDSEQNEKLVDEISNYWKPIENNSPNIEKDDIPDID